MRPSVTEALRPCSPFDTLLSLATGAAALMAIRVLLDHSVPEEKIALLSLLVSKQGQIVLQSLLIASVNRCLSGVQTVAYAFPKVKIVTTACDTEIDPETFFIRPGLGNFGDRYFGTDRVVDSQDSLEMQDQLLFQACPPDSPQIDPRRTPVFRQTTQSPSVQSRSSDQDEVFSAAEVCT